MKFYFVLFLVMTGICAQAQDPLGGVGNRFRGIKNAGSGNDSLARRNKFEDSITISYRYLDTLRNYKMDSSINDFTRYYPMPAEYNYLGNFGNAAQSYVFAPNMKAGWDPGFHAFDIYKYTVEKARFFTATRPYSELNYMLGTRSEQFIELMHTQNFRPNWNTHFAYRLLNSPGLFQNQKSAHNSYYLTNWVQSKDKRYNNYIIIAANKLQNTENGGVTNSSYIDSVDYARRDYIPVRLGGGTRYSADFFNTNIATGNRYADFNALMRQQFDLGRKDSLVTDSTVIPLFFPRIRLEHTIRYSKYTFMFTDAAPDAPYYQDHYDYPLTESSSSTFSKRDDWKEMVNDFSIYTFPDAKNTQQFIKLGAGIQNLSGVFDTLQRESVLELIGGRQKESFYNIFGHGEYRNRTKNQKWDMMANGKIYFAGMNAGDYELGASVQSLLGKKIGSLLLGAQNVNRTPSFVMQNPISSFHLMQGSPDLKKENISHLYATIYQPLLKLGLSGHYYLMTNYSYYTDFYKINQYNSLFNVLQIGVNKVFEAGKTKQWKWRTEVYFQQVVGGAPLHIPTIYTRNRLGYEGKLGFPKLNIAMGLEAKYRTNYKGDGYSPILGQFFYQDDQTVQYKLPTIAAYLNFRINSFKAFVRAENLNTFRNLDGSWGFTNNNFAATDYPYPGLLIRLGVFWGFVN
ncbi:putative porin [Niabella aurantiaca]|uniref:putative porin n=1 Tax=Niabella aurantiaca TaxID=379900 RepID=UPI0003673D37|nr:putative porin [Niabella aurantiaca]